MQLWMSLEVVFVARIKGVTIGAPKFIRETF